MPENEQLTPEELQVSKLATVPVDAKELEAEEKMEGVETIVVDASPEDLDKKNYYKISPTLYVQAVKNEDEDSEVELFKILNPVTGVVEQRELTDEEKKELFITELKRSQKKFNPISHPTATVGIQTVISPIGRKRQIKEKEVLTNVTTNQFGAKYKQKRKRKNKLRKTSRKANR